MREVEPEPVGFDERAFLGDMGAEHLAQRGVHQVGRRMVRHDLLAAHGVHFQLRLRAELHIAGHQLADMHMHIPGALLHVAHDEARAALEDDLAVIARLAAGFGVEGRRVEHQFGFAGRHVLREQAAGGDRHQLAVAGGRAVAAKFRRAGLGAGLEPDFLGRAVAGREACGAAGAALDIERRLEAGHVDVEPAAAQDVLRQVERKAVSVRQFERHIARQRRAGLQLGERLVEQRQAVAQRALEAGLLLLDRRFDGDLRAAEFRIGLAHFGDQRRHQLVHQRLARAEHVAMAHGAPHDPAQHIAAPFVRRQHAVRHQESRGAQVVGDDAERGRLVAGRFLAVHIFFRIDQCAEQVDVIVVVLALQDCGNPLEAHAGIDRGLGQAGALAAFVLLELHEHEVPDLDEAVTVLIGAARRAAGDLVAVVEEDFRTGAARAGIAHRPEIVARRDPDDPRIVKARDLLPDRGGFLVLGIDGDQQAFRVEPVILGDKLPGEADRVVLEIVAEGKIPQHFEEGVVARGVADIVEVIVLAAGAHAFLRRRGARRKRGFHTGEDVLERHHACVDEQQGRVVLRHQRRRWPAGMAVLLKKAEERLPDLVNALHLCSLPITKRSGARLSRGARWITEAI